MEKEEIKQEISSQQPQQQNTGQNSQDKNDLTSQICSTPQQSEQELVINVEEILRQLQILPIRPLGFGSFGIVYLVYDLEYGIVAAKISIKNKTIQREWEAAVNIQKKIKSCPFILKYLKQLDGDNCSILLMEYASLKTLDIIAKYPQIPLPISTLRALMKQILEGMRIFHEAGFIHRDIKCDNILLHSPPNTGLVHAKISDLGFAKEEDQTNEQTYLAGTLPYMAIELFNKPRIVTQKVDIYALGITFYQLITHCYPVNEESLEDQKIKLVRLKMIRRHSEIKNDLLWDILSKMLEQILKFITTVI
ncbi:MAG: hypothetical protein EZS28_010547 [Streblomastix strix]|uniref:non-specific serine/threonine protein kinase n=1 Tax=Streblomastix strix TaxID=222440 RepID=A0A5J4WGY2_9EUKA|nr:MAG: hypothetical protein EZS28_010547 [Streblomastix strix]